MISSLDPQTKKFYFEMGFTEHQITSAYEYSQRTGADMLDALNMPEQSIPPPLPPPPLKQRDNYIQTQSFNYNSSASFLTPWSKIKPSDYEVLFSKLNKQQPSVNKVQLREENYPVGLLNVSNCCYLNSLLQCYFLMNAFKVAILTTEPLPNLEQVLAHQSKTKVKRIKNQYELLAKLKRFFNTMALTSKKYLDPTSVLQNLVDSVGEKISYGEEKDLSEINILIIERISEGLTFSKNYYQSQQQEHLLDVELNKQGSGILQNQPKKPFNSIFNPHQGAIKKLFYGTRAEYYIDASFQSQPPIVSDFTGLILNPRAGNLYKALDEEFNFQVQINGRLLKKTAFIRDEPQYLFLYINRMEYDREEGQMLKTQHKFTFDFVFYLDQYLEKYREEHSNSHQKIKELLTTKNKIKEQINYIQILFKKIQQCQRYAQQLQGWSDKLPKQDQFEQQYNRLEQKRQQVQKELDQIESRREQYHLMYIFVHRGDAVSGHYWGYGRNDQNWYRFDINTKLIQQDQIVIDLEKSAATPYALLYVKKQNLPKFDYKLHLDLPNIKEHPRSDFRSCFDPKITTELINENHNLHQQVISRNNQNIKNKTFMDYLNRYSAVRKIGKKYTDERGSNRLGQLQICNNFSLFLWTKEEQELCKFTLFEQAVLAASNSRITVQRLMQEGDLLHRIQKKFKNSCKGQLYLKSYCLLPKQVQKLSILYQEYQLTAFEVIWGSIILNEAQIYLDQWNAVVSQNNGVVVQPLASIKSRILRILYILKIRTSLLKTQQFQKAQKSLPDLLYISQMNNQITKLLFFSVITTGIKIDSLQQFNELSDQIGTQIAMINSGNSFEIDQKIINNQSSPLEQAINLVTQFNSALAKKQNPQKSAMASSATKPVQESKSTMKSQVKSSASTSPIKSNAFAWHSPSKDRKAQGAITNLNPILTLQPKQCWKIQQLEHLKVNYELGPKLIAFLKKLGPLPKIYKQILQKQKPFSISELVQSGLFINQAPVAKEAEQSLI